MRFSVNVSMLFKEVPFLERFARVSEAGFGAVEFWWPGGEVDELDEVVDAVKAAGVSVALMNFSAGDMAAGDRGIAGDPERAGEFRENVPVALELARSIGCRRMNILVGQEVAGLERGEGLKLAAENVGFAADEARASGIEVVVEAVNTFQNGPYLLHTTAQAVEFVRSVGRPNLKIQHDFYHMQRMEGNLVANLREHVEEIGHIQIADSPDRGQPGTGEINYPYVLGALEDLGYSGYVGLEYTPIGTTEESFAWIPEGGRGGEIAVSDLKL